MEFDVFRSFQIGNEGRDVIVVGLGTAGALLGSFVQMFRLLLGATAAPARADIALRGFAAL